MENQIMGVVLCGGQSRRMGQDKGLLPMADINWILNAKKKLQALVPFVVLSLRRQQWENIPEYKEIVTKADVFDDVPIQGPLTGLLSVHRLYPDFSFLVLACDNILVDQELLERLLFAFNNNRKKLGVLFERDKKWEPLVAVYSQKWLQTIYTRFLEQTSFSLKIKDFIQEDEFLILNANESEKVKLDNFNCLQDIERQFNISR